MAATKVLIAGGGIGGLSAAACLLKAGLDVEVYEQAAALGEVGAGIQISANASRVYEHLGLLDAIVERGALPRSYTFRLFDTGEVLQEIPLGKAYVLQHGVPYVTIHRADLNGILFDAIKAMKPTAVTLNAAVSGYTEEEGGVGLSFRDGSSAKGDILVGADGIKSAIRSQMLGNIAPDYTGDAAWRSIVETDSLDRQHRTSNVEIWVGPRKHAVIYPLRGGRSINFVGAVEYESWRSDSWVAESPWEEMRDDFSDWHESVQAVVAAARTQKCYRWALNDRAPTSTWSTGRVTLLGDAAHPTLPYMAQGAAMAVEDSAVLARVLSARAAKADRAAISEAIARYERNRLERTARVVNESRNNRDLFHLPTSNHLKQGFAERDINAERSRWLFSYDPITTALA